MNKYINELQHKILAETSEIEKDKLFSEIKRYVSNLPPESLKNYKEEAIESINKDFQEIEKLLETYELMKNNMLQYS